MTHHTQTHPLTHPSEDTHRHTNVKKEKMLKTNYPHMHLHAYPKTQHKSHTHTQSRYTIQRNHTDSHRIHTHIHEDTQYRNQHLKSHILKHTKIHTYTT